MNISNNNNSISLEEDNFFSEPKTNKSKKQGNKNKSKTSNSFFGKIINSVSKIGQGLKNIMSMKINYEDEDDYNPNLYEQISSRFNNNEEISLIDAPSFMEESNIQNQSNKKNESNIMMISQNEINNDNDINNNNNNAINNIESFNNSLNHQKEEIINTDLVPNNERKLSIKSTFLNKKRLNDRHLENIFEERNEEEEKNEEENLNVNISGNKNKILNKNKFENSFDSSRIKMNRTNSNIKNNTFKMNKLNNTSMMSLSMRSLDNIKNEISKRREENLRSVQDMYKKNGLKYNDEEDKELRKKILEEYYADKAKRNAEVKLKLEREKQRREEEFKKLKIRKESGFKYGSIPKKQNILSEMKSTEINFKPSYKKVIINNNSSILSQKEETKQINPNITFGNISNSQSQTNEIKIINNDINNDIDINKKKPNLKEEPKSLFGPSEVKKDEEKKQKESESKTNTGFFSNTESNLNAFNNNNKQAENKNTPSLFGNTNNEKKPIFDNRKQSIFSNIIVPQEKEKEKKEEIKTTNDKKQEDFFGSSINLEFKKNDESSLFKGNSDMKGIFGTQISNEKGGLFDQNNQVSQGINPKSLFNSNKPPINSLATQNNPFLKASNSNKGSTTNLFGVSSNNENNTQKQTSTTSFFGGFTPNPGKSLFG